MNDSQRFPLLEDAEVLYEADIGPLGLPIDSSTPLGQDKKAETKSWNPGNARASAGEDERDIGKKIHAKGRYEEEDETEEESYTSGFGLRVSGAYFDEKETSLRIEYKLLPEKDAQKAGGMDSAALHEMENAPLQSLQKDEEPTQAGAAGHTVYTGGLSMEKYAESVLGSELRATYDSGVLNIEYKNVELINGQKTYQRIVLKAESDGESVYDLTMRKFSDAGIDARAEYDGEFGSMVFTSMNGRAEGVEGNFNEFYLNGEIGADSADKAALKKGDIVEWRYAEETDGSCGGSPDFSSIKSALEYSAVARAQAEHFGLLVQRPYSASVPGFSGGLTFQ